MTKIRFFVTGHGRSGTKWLAAALDRADDVHVYHEPPQGDVFHYMDWFYGKGAISFLIQRKRCILEEIASANTDYAEVNSYLRYCVPALRQVYRVPVVAIIRDGKSTVRSMLLQGVYQYPNYPPIQPVAGEWAKRWPNMTPHERACWYWADTYDRLAKDAVEIFRLDLLNLDYAYFNRLCERLGVVIGEEEWQKSAGYPLNQCIEIDKPLGWTVKEHEAFERIAGRTQGLHFGSIS